jgi:hypothetical protein
VGLPTRTCLAFVILRPRPPRRFFDLRGRRISPWLLPFGSSQGETLRFAQGDNASPDAKHIHAAVAWACKPVQPRRNPRHCLPRLQRPVKSVSLHPSASAALRKRPNPCLSGSPFSNCAQAACVHPTRWAACCCVKPALIRAARIEFSATAPLMRRPPRSRPRWRARGWGPRPRAYPQDAGRWPRGCSA